MGAQKIILKELETQFGGSAEAAASPMERLKVVVGNLQEEMGARLLPVVASVATWLADRLPAALDRLGAIAGPIFAMVSSGFKAVVEAFKQGGPGVQSEAEGFIGVMERMGLAARSVVDWIRENWPKIQETVSSVMETVQAVISGVIDVVSTIWNNFGEQIMSYTREAFDAVRQVIGGAMDVIQGIIKTVTSIIHGDWSSAWDGIKQVLAGAWGIINGLVDQAVNTLQTIMSIGLEILGSIVSSAFDGIVGFIASIPGRIVDALGNVDDLLWDAGMAIMRGFLNGLKAGFEAVKNFVGGVGRWIADHKGPITADRKLLVPAGQAIMDGLVSGLRDHENRLVSQLAHMTGMVGGVAGPASIGTSAATGIAPRSGAPGAGGPTSITINITVNGPIEPQHLAREIAWAIGA